MKYKSFLYLLILGSFNCASAEPNHSKSPCLLNFIEGRSAWLINGNDSIDPTENFIGAFDGESINISANCYPTNLPFIRVTAKGQIEVLNTRQGVFIGEGAGTLNNAENDTFVGFNAGHNTIEEPVFQQPGDNTSFGCSALFSNTIGQDNTAVGSSALFSTVQASQNIAVGFQALFASTDGAFNTAVGASALNAETTGSFNTAIGYSALHNNAQNYGLGKN